MKVIGHQQFRHTGLGKAIDKQKLATHAACWQNIACPKIRENNAKNILFRTFGGMPSRKLGLPTNKTNKNYNSQNWTTQDQTERHEWSCKKKGMFHRQWYVYKHTKIRSLTAVFS